MFSITKDPQSDLDYTIDWSAWLGATDTIASSSWSASGVTTHGAALDDTAKLTTIWIAGGTVHTPAFVTNHIVTVAGRVDERSIEVRVVQR